MIRIRNHVHTTVRQPRSLTPEDIALGKRIRAGRLRGGLTLLELAALVSLTYQTVQRYETATVRVSALRLRDLARALGKSMEWFFEGDEA